MKKKRNEIDLTGVPKKDLDSLYQYVTIYKSAKEGQKSFRITSQLLNSVYKKAKSLKKKGLIILTIPSNSKYNFKVKCIVAKEKI